MPKSIFKSIESFLNIYIQWPNLSKNKCKMKFFFQDYLVSSFWIRSFLVLSKLMRNISATFLNRKTQTLEKHNGSKFLQWDGGILTKAHPQKQDFLTNAHLRAEGFLNKFLLRVLPMTTRVQGCRNKINLGWKIRVLH